MKRRKVTFKLSPNATQAERLTGWIRLHCELYNAALEERISAYQKHGKSISYYDQQNVLPEIKAARPEFVELGSHALQQTLRKLDLAFQAFFRRGLQQFGCLHDGLLSGTESDLSERLPCDAACSAAID